MKVGDLSNGAEFILSEYLGEDTGSGELRLTFYRKETNVDKRTSVVLFGCIQIVIDKNHMDKIYSEDWIIRPRYNNLDGKHTSITSMSNQYDIAQYSNKEHINHDVSYNLRTLYTNIRYNVPEALNRLTKDD